MQQALEFHLDHFDGPMDLLMHLIEKNKIDVYDIPISEITDQYLMFLDAAQNMNLEIASHFLLFAAGLVRIKIKMLLPKRQQEETEEDPRKDLVDQIIAYRFFKELSTDLEELQGRMSRYHQREVDLSALREKYKNTQPPEGLDASLLLNAFMVLEQHALEMPEILVVEKQNVSIEIVCDSLIAYCRNAKRPTFQTLLKNCTTTEEMLSYFIALLECIKLDIIVAVQNELFGDIQLYARAG